MCTIKCPVGALTLTKSESKKEVIIDKQKCIGCGVCVNFCAFNNLNLSRKDNFKIVPKDTFERIVTQAINAGKLQNYIFDNQESFTNEILRKFLKVMLSLPPVKLVLANNQIRSQFLNVIIKKKKFEAYRNIYYKNKKIDYKHYELKGLKHK